MDRYYRSEWDREQDERHEAEWAAMSGQLAEALADAESNAAEYESQENEVDEVTLQHMPDPERCPRLTALIKAGVVWADAHDDAWVGMAADGTEVYLANLVPWTKNGKTYGGAEQVEKSLADGRGPENW